MQNEETTTKSRWIAGIGIGLAIGAGSLVAGAAFAQANDSGAVVTPLAATPLETTDDWLAQYTAEERQRSLETATRDGASALNQVFENYDNDRHPVFVPGGGEGYISNATMDLPFPETVKDLGPVVDGDGTVIGYWGNGIGFISLSEASAPDFDPIRLADERGHRSVEVTE